MGAGEHVVVPIVIGVILVVVVVLLVACKCVEERNREREFRRLQEDFDNKLSQMQESHNSSFASETNPYSHTTNSGVRQRQRDSYRQMEESESEEEKEEEDTAPRN